MKKTLIIGATMVIVGTFLFGMGYAKGGNKNIYWKDGGFRVDNSKVVTKRYADIDSIKIQSEDPITIQRGNVDQVQVKYRTSTELSHNSANKTLSIKDNVNQKYSVGFDFNHGVSEHDNRVLITIPNKLKLKEISGVTSESVNIDDLRVGKVSLSGGADFTLNKVTVDKPLKFNSGDDLTLRNVTAPMVSADLSDGDIYVDNGKFDKDISKVTTSDGDVDVHHSSFKELDVSSDDGDLTINHSRFAKKLTTKTLDGDTLITGIDKNKTDVHAETSDGNLSVFGNSKRNHRVDHAKATIDVSSEDGDVTVKE